MAYIGNKLADSYTSFAKQDFTTSATTSYTLDYPVANANEIALFINFVRQEPTTAYTASGTSLTLTSATSASDDMYCVFLGKALQTVNPPAGSVGLSQLSATGTASASTYLRGDNSWGSITIGDNTPAFKAIISSGSQSFTNAAVTKIQFNSEVFDTDGCYDPTTNYRFTPTTAGKYFVYLQFAFDSGVEWDGLVGIISKNGSYDNIVVYRHENYHAITMNHIVDMNGTTDYLEAFCQQNSGGSLSLRYNSGWEYNIFGAFKLNGV